MKYFLLTSLCLILNSCTNQTNQNNNQSSSDSSKTILIDSTSIKNTSSETKKNLSKFSFENDTISQTIEIDFITNNEILFSLKTINKKNNQESKLEGKAISNNGDFEIDEDEEGNAYPAQEFTYSDQCQLYIRLAAKEKDKLIINESNCKKLHSAYCPLSSIGTLKKLN